MEVWPRIEAMVEAHGACALVSVVSAVGSTPREAGTCMIVRPDGAFHGTIGGGALEWQALARAQAMLARAERATMLVDQVLGPDLGQCCGGRVALAIETFDRRDRTEIAALAAAERAGPFGTAIDRPAGGRTVRRILKPGAAPAAGMAGERFGERPPSILLFGAGHVGRALVLALAPLPFRVVWCDSRPGAFPAAIPANVTTTAASADAVLAAAPAGAEVLVMTHSHALDLDIVEAALMCAPVAGVGLIGSATKRARFARQLAGRGVPASRIAALRCPLGLPGIGGKEPPVIAAAIAAECLLIAEARTKAAVAPVRGRRPTRSRSS
ncbi:xanthine dehydrogenase accessory protein XdhC [Phreatobacter sp. AB_2022a]|uniref:xanthine dehydrogenase accessory protein XdhC n=1 Tax=Phreatobacter sp. AB_2022a TaxID=3003134 RepID=UPI0022870379|nr:xanthine dehydrogenase accessory protein XdhC [Phreatobacter sp. AB_2022a]MCZ0733576.1 xanthine dehydrogenase accessory protein XdhC [Phreatobacter sp. AB_2022a]